MRAESDMGAAAARSSTGYRVAASRGTNGSRLCALLLAVSAVLIGVLSCSESPTSPDPVAGAALVLQAPADVMQNVATVTLTVTGPGMDAITRNMNVQGSQATLSLNVPAGEDRTFTVSAKDSAGTVLATGSTTVDLEAGSSRTVTVSLDIPTWIELVYDDGDPSGGYYWQTSGYGFGVDMASPQYPATILSLRYYIRNLQSEGSGDGSFTVRVFDYDGAPASPISPTIAVTPTETGWVEVDVSSYNIQVQRGFVAGIFYDGTNTPSLGYDVEDNYRGWIYVYDDYYDTWEWEWWPETLFIRATVALSTGEIVQLPEAME